MFRTILVLFILLIIIGCSKNEIKHNEKYYQTSLCKKLDGEMEYVLKDRTRVDCLTDEYAIEVDFAKKWAESIGQSLYYAHSTGKKPAVAIIIDSKKEQRYLKRLIVITNNYGIKVFVIEKIR